MGRYEELVEEAQQRRDSRLARIESARKNAIKLVWNKYDEEIDRAREELPVLEGVSDNAED